MTMITAKHTFTQKVVFKMKQCLILSIFNLSLKTEQNFRIFAFIACTSTWKTHLHNLKIDFRMSYKLIRINREIGVLTLNRPTRHIFLTLQPIFL